MRALDASFSRISRDVFRQLREEGWEAYCQNLWTGGFENNEALRRVAEANLRGAEAEGMVISGYCNASPWFQAETSVQNAMLNAGEMWGAVRVVACDVEIDGLTEAQILATCEALRGAGKVVPIYTARWFWHGRLGNPEWGWLRGYKLWLAQYDEVSELDSVGLFGPWQPGDVVGKQYAGTTNLHGAQFDLNTFEGGYWGGVDMPSEEEFRRLVDRAEALEERLARLEASQLFQDEVIVKFGRIFRRLRGGLLEEEP